MSRIKRTLGVVGACALVAPVLFFSVQYLTPAADHLDPPGRTDPQVDTTPDTPADIADVYAWHTDGSLIVAVTFAGPQPGDRAANYDRNVLYGINLSTDGVRDTVEIPIRVRFGQGGGGNGVQFSGLPGVTGTLEGSVETDLVSANGIKARAGLFDDPFAFDLQGFRETRSSGTLSFNKDRNFFAKQNDTAIVLEIPRTLLNSAANPVDIWASTARFGGQL